MTKKGLKDFRRMNGIRMHRSQNKGSQVTKSLRKSCCWDSLSVLSHLEHKWLVLCVNPLSRHHWLFFVWKQFSERDLADSHHLSAVLATCEMMSLWVLSSAFNIYYNRSSSCFVSVFVLFCFAFRKEKGIMNRSPRKNWEHVFHLWDLHACIMTWK